MSTKYTPSIFMHILHMLVKNNAKPCLWLGHGCGTCILFCVFTFLRNLPDEGSRLTGKTKRYGSQVSKVQCTPTPLRKRDDFIVTEC